MIQSLCSKKTCVVKARAVALVDPTKVDIGKDPFCACDHDVESHGRLVEGTAATDLHKVFPSQLLSHSQGAMSSGKHFVVCVASQI